MPRAPEKPTARRRHLPIEAWRRPTRVKIQKTVRKQAIRQSGQRRGGR